jgi:hypothetical protein
VITPVAVEKVGSSEKSGKSGDGKCPGDCGKSFVELPDAKRFLPSTATPVINSYQNQI